MITAVLLLAILVVYVLIAAKVASGIHTRYPRRHDSPNISIVIPARNEEQNLPVLLDSLLAIDYPADKLEIILVNDQSDDRTREIAESYRGRFRCGYDVLDVQPEPNSALRAKTRPLAQGLDRARGELILMPDADNRVPPEWARAMTSYFTDGVGMVCGPIYPDPQRGSRVPLTWFETVDVAFLLGTCAGFSGLGKTQALIGSNFAVRRETYEAIGTYRNLDFHIIEDISLLRAIQQSGTWKAIFPGEPGTMLWTLPQPSLKSLVIQRHRWLAGWQYVKPGIRAALTFGMAVHVMWPLWLFFSPVWFATLYTLLALGNGLVAAKSLKCYGRGELIWLLPLYPVYAATYAFVLLFMLVTRRKVRWKEREFIE